jgi:hypothetical protein
MAVEIQRNPFSTVAHVVTQEMGAQYKVRHISELVTQTAGDNHVKTVYSKSVLL